MTTQKEYVDYGDLKSLIGTWEGQTGWNVIAVPALDGGKKSYKLMVQNYYERLTVEPINDPVLNEGGAVDQIIGALKYKQEIFEFESNNLLHVETGMFFYLDNIANNTDEDSAWMPPYTVARSGTIPHGNSIMLLGDAAAIEGAVDVPDISTYPDLPESYLGQYEAEQQRLSVKDIVTGDDHAKIFDVKNPNYNLNRDNRGLEILETVTVHVDSKEPGGMVNLPFINKFANTTWANADFWVQKVNLPMSDRTYTQMQYSQHVDLEFEIDVDGETKMVTFPHVTTNTLKLRS